MPMRMYAPAINGTMIWVQDAIRVTPPKITSAVKMAMTPATTVFTVNDSLPKEPETASAMELVWMALYTKP
mgnify:CR=1 FL=1